MKLRLRGNSLRLRLTATETRSLHENGWWQDATAMGMSDSGAALLAYRVEAADMSKATVRFTSGEVTMVTVLLPFGEVEAWATDDAAVGMYFDETWGLKVAVEKDYRCLDPRRDEDESDNFENPNVGTGHQPACETKCGTAAQIPPRAHAA